MSANGCGVDPILLERHFDCIVEVLKCPRCKRIQVEWTHAKDNAYGQITRGQFMPKPTGETPCHCGGTSDGPETA